MGANAPRLQVEDGFRDLPLPSQDLDDDVRVKQDAG
jgi:hypothetical protein